MDPARWADDVLPEGSFVYIDYGPGRPGLFCDKRRLAALLAEAARIPQHARLTPFRFCRTSGVKGGVWRRSPDLRALVYLQPAGERARWWLEGVAPLTPPV